MDLNNVSVAIRPRNDWEAIDLGFRMARAYWLPLFVAWACVLLPVVTLIQVLLIDSLGWALVVIWWLKPLLDRVLLIVLSRSVFGAAPTLKQTLRAVPSALSAGTLHALTLARGDPGRSFAMPVWQLEGLKGSARRQRIRTIERRTRSAALWHTAVCWQLELIIFAGLFVLILSLLPEQVTYDWEFWNWQSALPLWAQLGRNALYVLAILIVEPFYVAGGFGLYLNRRTVLEGWDIEIAFRQMVSRILAQQGADAA